MPTQLAQCWFPGLWPFTMLKYLINIFSKIKYAEAVLSHSTRKVLRFEIGEMLIAVSKKNKFTVLFIIIFGTFVTVIFGACRDLVRPSP